MYQHGSIIAPEVKAVIPARKLVSKIRGHGLKRDYDYFVSLG